MNEYEFEVGAKIHGRILTDNSELAPVVTDPACASAWTCGPRGSARPSEPPRRGRARPRSRQRGRWLRCPDRPEPVGATAQIDRPSGATWVLAGDGYADRPGPRRCSAPRRRARPAVPCRPVVPPPPASSLPTRWRSPAFAQRPRNQALAGHEGGAQPPIDRSVSSTVCHSPVFPQRSDRYRIRHPRAAPNHVRVSHHAGRYELPARLYQPRGWLTRL